LQTITGLGPHEYRLAPNFISVSGLREYSVAAGGFTGGATDGTPPTASFAVSLWAGNPFSNRSSNSEVSEFEVDTFAAGVSGTTGGFRPVSRKTYGLEDSVDYGARMPLLAYDRAGQSFYLGAPVHITVLNAPRTDYAMEEPPKHAYWDEGTEQVINLTRFDGNNVHLYNSTTSSFLDESIDTSDRTTGGSIYATAGLTTKGGQNFGIVAASGEISVDVGIGGSYDYNEHKEQYNSQYQERTIGSQASTDRDDFLIGALQTYDVWRYRVYGTPQGEPLNYFYEIVMPGPEVPFAGGGLNFDWYQPIHENGNILSYPAVLGPGPDPRVPVDLGTFTLPGGEEKTEPLVPPQLSYFDGTGESFNLDFSTDIANAESFTYSHTLGENANFEIAVKATATILKNEVSTRGCGSIEFHNSNSWGGTHTTRLVERRLSVLPGCLQHRQRNVGDGVFHAQSRIAGVEPIWFPDICKLVWWPARSGRQSSVALPAGICRRRRAGKLVCQSRH
jgi:hypothetical protein